MTIAARINQSDLDRVAKFVKRADIERARILLNPRKGLIEIVIGDPEPLSGSGKPSEDDWDDLDD